MPLPTDAYAVTGPDADFDVLTDNDQRRYLDEQLRTLRAQRILNLPVEIAPTSDRALVNGILAHVHRTHGHRKVCGWKWATLAWDEVSVIGCVVASAPRARHQDDGRTIEVIRLACMEGPGQVGSRLLGSVARAAKAQGFERLLSYSLEGQAGTVYKAAGWSSTGMTKGGSRRRGRGADGDPDDVLELEGPKVRWEKRLRA